ncbi:MAG: 3-dehydroquinate synthase [candidate division KSB1 bacterium]|nr:3-dehydroquinate synthase [candidate division KSB1 bacterium]MDZ7336224.1 3-dehydroquinate synthase [candidate division KSB1 bacterium]MDZ7357623.1 3-dehydroquinate synthase [candidate division KSB1 bacterium]MDZ7375573.1 3-dehydroquinate synthase [candidate division KSB1 bacterium]MDZ7401564.1 3-dehydroquinate synthase [candidate division KSB1 bacterium]
MRILTVNLGHRSYPIFIEVDSFHSAAKELVRLCEAKRYVVITDENVSEHYLDPLERALASVQVNWLPYKIAPGEPSKSLNVASQIYTWLLANQIHRDDVIIALGGGVVGDLAGFIAATYLRGLRWVQIPTTLLAQVDSSVGGKVGVNHPLAKNSIGAFYQPQMVWIDPATLKTLPKREIYNGLAEVIKYGLILDRELFDFLEAHWEKILTLEKQDYLTHVIRTCCRLKATVVEQDERESDYRRILNFGHTIGHALEKLTDYSYFRHGEAIAWGMLAAVGLSQQQCALPSDQAIRANQLIDRIEKPKLPAEIDMEPILQVIQGDKKMTSAGLKFVLIQAIGECRVDLIDPNSLAKGIQTILTHSRAR